MIARETMVDTTLLGHRIPKGVTLLISSAGPGYYSPTIQVPDAARNPTSLTKHWGGEWNTEDMTTFKPERWLQADAATGTASYNPQAGPFLSFDLGPRSCFGKRLAYLEMRVVLTLLLWNFHFRKLSPELSKNDTLESVTSMPKTCYAGIDRI